MRKFIALFAVLILLAGCPSDNGGDNGWENGGDGQAGGGSTGGGGGGQLSIENGTSTQVSGGEPEPGEEVPPAAEYMEDVNANLFIYFINVGSGDVQGDAILVKKGDFDMLVDAGPEAQKQDVVNFLLGKGVDDIEVLVSTHDDAEHSGGLRYVSENFRIGEVWRPEEGSGSYGAMIDSLGAENGVKYMVRGDERLLNGIRVIVRNPQEGESRFFDSDNDGIVLRLQDRGFCTLLTADIDSSAQTQILMDSEPCDVVQMPWHGMSEGLNSVDFLFDKLEPSAIIVSGSASDWTNSRQTLYFKAGVRGIPVYENYNGTSAKITFNGDEFAITIEK